MICHPCPCPLPLLSSLPRGLGRRGPTRRPPLSHQTQCSTCFPITWQARQRCSKFIFYPERGKQRQGRPAAALGQLGKLCSQPGGTEPAGRARRQGALSDPPSGLGPGPASRSPRLRGSSRLPRPQTPARTAPSLSPTVSLPLCLVLFLTAPFPLHSTSLPSPHNAPLPYPPLPHLSPTAPPSLCLISLHPTCLLPNPSSHLDLSPLSFPSSQLPSLLLISSP